MNNIEERIHNIKTASLCALFLVSIKEGKGEPSLDEAGLEAIVGRLHSLLARVFPKNVIIERLDSRHFIIFQTCDLLGQKACAEPETFGEVLQDLANESERPLRCCLGGYIFRAGEDSFEEALSRAKISLELAERDEKKNFYVNMASDLKFGPSTTTIPASQLIRYAGENIRLLRVGEHIESVYASPGFFWRLSLKEEDRHLCRVRMQPASWRKYRDSIRETARTGEPCEGSYYVFSERQVWVPCHFKHLKVMDAEDGTALVLELAHNLTLLRQMEVRYGEGREWLQLLSGHTGKRLWSVDIASRTFRLLYTADLMEGRQSVYRNFPESLIASGRIHGESIEAFRTFALEMLRGKREDSGRFMLQFRQTSCFGWATLSYRMLYDGAGNPVKAVGLREDLSFMPDSQTPASCRRLVPADMLEGLYGYMQANLSRNVVEKLAIEGQDQAGITRYHNYDEVVAAGFLSPLSQEDSQELATLFDRQRLLNDISARNWLFSRVRVIDHSGQVIWLHCGVNLIRTGGDRYLFAYLNKQGGHQQLEEPIRDRMQLDMETGTYTQEAARLLVQRCLSLQPEQCALALVQICGLEDAFRPEEQASRGKDIATALGIYLENAVVSRGEGGLLVLFPRAPLRAALREKLERAFSFVRLSLGEDSGLQSLRLVAGVVYKPDTTLDQEDMIEAARETCLTHAGEVADCVAFFEAGPANVPANRTVSPADDLVGEGRDILLECMDSMLNSDNSVAAIDAVLGKIGNYLGANRVYILALAEHNRTISMVNEWVRDGRSSVRQMFFGQKLCNFPFLVKAVQNWKPVFTASRGMFDTPPFHETKGWQYVVLPMGEAGTSGGHLLCLENPVRYREQGQFLPRLVPYLLRARGHLVETEDRGSSLARLLRMSDLNSYMDMIYSMDSDVYSSIGVLTMDIPELEALKRKYGYEYGVLFLLHMSDVLADVFGNSQLFHITDAEFIVLCVDVGYDFFMSQCNRVVRMIEPNYAGLFRMGQTWANGIFNGRDLVKRARQGMQYCGELPSKTQGNVRIGSQIETGINLEQHDAGQPTIFLQPKIDMRTGTLVGAEALFRLLDADGRPLPHVQVIDRMEGDGTIHTLDYFVYDKLLETMSRWYRDGYTLFPVSSNFSRKTLMQSSLLASLLAILSHYPEIPPEIVEMEITETACDVENRALVEMIERFGSYGLYFSLDDFGTGYSNISVLADTHFNSVKLDRSLVRDISSNKVLQVMIRDLLRLCHSRNILCVAEGVETEQQVAALLEAGCFHAQGYYYDRPLSIDNFERKYLRK